MAIYDLIISWHKRNGFDYGLLIRRELRAGDAEFLSDEVARALRDTISDTTCAILYSKLLQLRPVSCSAYRILLQAVI
jgi:hypothetical protein